MKILFYLAGGVLALAGVLHLVIVITTPYDPVRFLPTASTVLFGVADIIVGVMLLRGVEKALPYGVAVPLIGGLLVLLTMSSAPSAWNPILLVIDVFVVAACLFLLRSGRPAISRVK